jgi:hypothetical protein
MHPVTLGACIGTYKLFYNYCTGICTTARITWTSDAHVTTKQGQYEKLRQHKRHYKNEGWGIPIIPILGSYSANDHDEDLLLEYRTLAS